MTDFVKNLEFWMTNLPQKLKHLPIIYLAIPGSHDSTTYAIQRKSRISPDIRPPLQYLKFLRPILGPVLLKWSKTQSVSINEQLNYGIRYFDLRISTKSDDDGFYFVHNLYSEKVAPVFDDFVTFLDNHPNEIVILDCQHFFKFNAKDHTNFIHLLISKFGKKMLPYEPNIDQITLDYMTQNLQCQVILIYRNENMKTEKLLWPSKAFPTPWPDTLSVCKLFNCLDNGLKERNSSFGYVSQCVLTPNVWYVCRNLFGCLKNNCFLPLDQQKYIWLKKQKPGIGGINIVISDFVECDDHKFSKEVISLNRKLLVHDFGDQTLEVDD